MTSRKLPPGLVLWPEAGGRQRIAVLISDIHCTDCSVGNQTADEADWESFFTELGQKLHASVARDGEVVIILNGDVVDLLRSGKWAEAGVYPWQRKHPRFSSIVMDIMRDIEARHSLDPDKHERTSGFFHYLRNTVKELAPARVTIIPIVGNHDKELQVVPEARAIYYRDFLGLSGNGLSSDYRRWVAEQMGSDASDTWPKLPFYFADPSLRLFATHGQWRDDTNSRSTKRWNFRYGRWQPQLWQEQQYRSFSEPCFGDTIASGLLSHFISNATKRIENEVIPFALNRSKDDGITRIQRVLGEMDLYRPAEMAVVRLLEEAKKLDRNADIFLTVLDQYSKSMRSWLEHPETFRLAPWPYKFKLLLVYIASRFNWIGLNIYLMRKMARKSDSTDDVPYSKLPIFRADYQSCGFQLHVEGHTHMTMEVDLRNSGRFAHRNYTYVNLGAWRNRIVQKFDIRRFRLCSKSYRRHDIGRVLIVQSKDKSASTDSGYKFTLRDITSWGDRLD